MSKHLILTTICPETGRATETRRISRDAFVAERPDLAALVCDVLRTGKTAAVAGLYIARGAGRVR